MSEVGAFVLEGDGDRTSTQMSEEDIKSMIQEIRKKKYEGISTRRNIKAIFLLLLTLALVAAIITVALLYGSSLFSAYIFTPLAVVLGIVLLTGYFYYRSAPMNPAAGVDILESDSVPLPAAKAKPHSSSYGTELKAFKIVVMGPKGAGKTAALNHYLDSRFSETQSSTAVSFRSKIVEGIKYDFWDMPAAATYATLLPQAFKGADFVILAYDMSDRASFEDLPKQLEKIQPDTLPVLLLGCKADKESQVSYEEAEEFAKANHLSFAETSAKTGLNIEDAFKFLIDQLKAQPDPGHQPAAELLQ